VFVVPRRADLLPWGGFAIVEDVKYEDKNRAVWVLIKMDLTKIDYLVLVEQLVVWRSV
jgi:hypothetical protein